MTLLFGKSKRPHQASKTFVPSSSPHVPGNLGTNIHRSKLHEIPSTNGPPRDFTSNQPSFFTLEQLVVDQQKLKEQYGVIMTTLRDKTSHPFTHTPVSFKILKNVIARAIPKYNGNDNPITHINRHEASLLRMTDNDDHLALLFPSTLLDTTSSLSFDLFVSSLRPWKDIWGLFRQC